jgi:hypothetical protein
LASLFAVGEFATSEQLIYYASEVKPYSSDLMCTLLRLIACIKNIDARGSRRAVIWLGMVQFSDRWRSYPSVFVAAAGFLVLAVDALTANEPTSILKRHQLGWLAGEESLYAVSSRPLARLHDV